MDEMNRRLDLAADMANRRMDGPMMMDAYDGLMDDADTLAEARNVIGMLDAEQERTVTRAIAICGRVGMGRLTDAEASVRLSGEALRRAAGLPPTGRA